MRRATKSPTGPVITDRVVTLFMLHEALQSQYLACLSKPCVIAKVDARCDDCKRYCDATHDLSIALKADAWQISGCDADSPEPTPEMHNDSRMADAWRRSWQLRCELEAAVAKRKLPA
jgi:hypothetical protein